MSWEAVGALAELFGAAADTRLDYCGLAGHSPEGEPST